MFCNQKRNLAEDSRAARTVRKKREPMFSNAPEGRVKANAELPSTLKGALCGEILMMQNIGIYCKATAREHGEMNMEPWWEGRWEGC